MSIAQLEDALVASAQAVIAAGYWTGPDLALRWPDQETEHVATLIDTCVLRLTPAWATILAETGRDLTFHGAFLHQRPKVRFPSPTMNDCGAGFCEAADLLVVIDHGTKARRACLIQAKCDPGDPPRGDQKVLYERWEPFRFAHGHDRAKGPVYSIGPNSDGARYGVVRDPPPRQQPPWILEHPLGSVVADDMGHYLARMLIATVDGAPGPARPATINGSDDWSRLIDDLLRVSLKKKYPLSKFWPEPIYRGFRGPIETGIPHFLTDERWEAFAGTAIPGDWDDGPPGGEDRVADDDGPDPVSLLHITLSPRED